VQGQDDHEKGQGIGNSSIGNKPEFHMDMLLTEWMNAYIDEQKRNGVKNTAVISKEDKDFCLMFIDYLRNGYRIRFG